MVGESARSVPRWHQLAEYRALPLVPGSPQARFVTHSLRTWVTQTVPGSAMVLGLLSFGASGSWNFLEEKAFQAGNTVFFAAAQLAWQLGADGPIPAAVEVPPLPPGQLFKMGCVLSRDIEIGTCPRDEPELEVSMSQPLAIAKTEVTNLQFARYLWWTRGFAWNPLASRSGTGVFGTPARPVVKLDFNEAVNYAIWLGKKTTSTWRLPTEAEWEYAARVSNEGGPLTWGKASPKDRANCNSCGDGNSGKRTAPVASHASSRGLYDMTCNVSEWTDTWYDETQATRALCGGSWKKTSGTCAPPTATTTATTPWVFGCVVRPTS